MNFKALKYAVIFSLLSPVAFAQLVKKDETADRNYFNEDGTMRIAIAIAIAIAFGEKVLADCGWTPGSHA